MGEIASVEVSQLVAHGDWVGFEYQDPFGRPAKGIVVRWGEGLVAYRNLCPHASLPLDARGGVVSGDGEHLVCQVHGARFDGHTGECVLGAAVGQRLERFELVLEPGGGRAKIVRGTKLSL